MNEIFNKIISFSGMWTAGCLGTTILGIAIKLALAWPMQLLWNWLMPTLFGLPSITFWQALGLCVLGWLLVGSPSFSLHSESKR